MIDIPAGAVIKIGDRYLQAPDWPASLVWTRRSVDDPWELTEQSGLRLKEVTVVELTAPPDNRIVYP